jgi:hypothetical protein
VKVKVRVTCGLTKASFCSMTSRFSPSSPLLAAR